MTAGAVSAPLIIPIIHLQAHRARNHIDIHTPVCIHSDTPGALILYTVDGSRPGAGQRGSTGRKYTEPILLPAGRVTVRAVAVSGDGRQSSMVTKVFSVDRVDSDQQNQPVDRTPGSPDENPAGSTPRPPEPRMMGNGSPPSGPRFLSSRLGSPTRTTTQTSSPECSGVLKQVSRTQTSRVQRETDFLRCAQCLSLRPSDPFARFCAQCGAVAPPLPEQRLPPAEGGQTLLCGFCDTEVPVNTQSCLICEASVRRQLGPQARRTLTEHVLCVSCGSGNPAHITNCLTCESRLQPQVCVAPSPDSRLSSCSTCQRLNRSDARYCDWCGCKPGHAARCVVCWRCGASGHPYALYCAACGVHLEAPAPPTSSGDITTSVRGATSKQAAASTSHDAVRQTKPASGPAPSVKVTPPTADQHTQTVGLYYPSATGLQKKDQQSRQQTTRDKDRPPPLTAVSPGRGYWRKQLDHVCAHLRSYAQNSAPFRTLLGEPRLGRMVSAVVHDDGYEVSVTVSFVAAGRGRQQQVVSPEGDAAAAGSRPGSAPAARTDTLSSVTERLDNSSRKQGSDASSGLKPHRLNLAPKPPVKDGQLLAELGPGRGRLGVVQQLLDQGADPSCCRADDGRHALVVAVVNGHHDVLPVLVQRGADVDQQTGQMKNTALHEAAALGSEGLQCAEVLLSCRAGVRRRNAAGQTPYDVAVSSGSNDMVSLLAARAGLDLLGKLGRTKLNLDLV